MRQGHDTLKRGIPQWNSVSERVRVMEVSGLATQVMTMQRAVSGQNMALAAMKIALQTDQAAAQLLAGAAAPSMVAASAPGSVGSNVDIRV